MADDRDARWNRYIANAQVDVSMAAFTKVPADWGIDNERPGFNRMYYFREGEGFVTVDGTTCRPGPGELFILPAGRQTSFGTSAGRTFAKDWCHFTAKVAGDLNLFDVVRAPLFVQPRDPEAVEDGFRRLYAHLQSDRLAAGFHVRSALLELLAAFLESADDLALQAKTTPAFGRMTAVLAYIEERIGEPITVEELARIAHFQPNYFIQAFKSFTGFPPLQYINRMRLDKAGQLLAFADLSVSDVADRVGMEFSYFSRMFKAYTGYTPTAYRSLMRDSPPAAAGK